MKRPYPANRRAFGYIYRRRGIWYVRYSTAKGKQRKESTRSARREDAEKLLARRQAEIESGAFALATIPAAPARRSALYVIRRDAGLSQAELARRAGVNASSVAQWETGHHWPRGLQRMVRLADTLGVTIDALLGREAPTQALPAAVTGRERRLLDALERYARSLIGDDILPRVGGWMPIAEHAFCGVLMEARDRLLDRPRLANPDAAERIEPEAAKRRSLLGRGKHPFAGALTQPPEPVSTLPVRVCPPPADWYEGWESPRQQARRMNQAEPAPRHTTAKKAAKTRKLLTAGAQ